MILRNIYFPDLGTCESCGNSTSLRNMLSTLLEDNMIDDVKFKRWTHTDRSNLETVEMQTDEFIDEFIYLIAKYMKHDFITKMQAASFKEKRINLKDSEMFVVLDFAENYSYVVQDEIQSFHWNNGQVTLHPFVGYYK